MSIKSIIALAAAVTTATSVFAEEGEAAGENSEATAEVKAESPKPAAKLFTTLPLCKSAEGQAEVLLPASKEWKAIEEGRFYPLGSAYRTANKGKIVIAFGSESKAKIEGNASFATLEQPIGAMTRTIVVGSGVLELDLARNTPEGVFSVAAPSFTIKNIAGESRITYTDKGDGDLVNIRCVTGTMGIDGRHFKIPTMRAADELDIRTSRDQLVTVLSGISGDFITKLDSGIVTKADIDSDGNRTDSTAPGELDWHLSVGTKVRINRLVPSVGERMSVAVMTFDGAGELKNNFAFCEGRAEVNTGDLVAAVEDGEAIAKKAAEATTTTEVAKDKEAEEALEEKEAEKETEESKSDEEKSEE